MVHVKAHVEAFEIHEEIFETREAHVEALEIHEAVISSN